MGIMAFSRNQWKSKEKDNRENQIKNWLFEKMNKLENTLSRLEKV